MEFKWSFALSSPLEITAAAEKPLAGYAKNPARNIPAQAWNGNAGYSEAVALAKTGWPDAPKLSELAEQIAPTETRTAHEMQHAVTGACVDVSRYLEGHPECMLEFCDEPAPRSLSIAIDASKACDVTAREMELAGAVALAVIDTLNRSGFNVDLSLVTAIEGYKIIKKRPRATGERAITKFPISRAGEPVDVDQLAFWLCHPAAFRQLILGFWDTCPRDFYLGTRQDHLRGIPRRAEAADAGVDYILSCSPANERAAATEYHRIISEITAAL